jgi:hypothetical protein
MATATSPNLRFNDFYLMLIGMPVMALLMPLVFFRDLPYNLITIAQSFVYTVVIWSGVRYLFKRVTQRFTEFSAWRKRLSWLVVLSTIYVVVACNIVGVVTTLLWPPSWGACRNIPSGIGGLASLIGTLMVGSVYESIRFFELWKNTLLEKQALEQMHLAGQLEGLRNQVNPHFLFNSLNTLLHLIHTDADRAERFVHQMSKVYRYVLESQQEALIPLHAELGFLKSYVHMLHERFGQNLRVDINVPPPYTEAFVVPLSLQLLIENAIKHNVISQSKPLAVTVEVADNHLIVRNNRQPKLQAQPSTGVGLENIRLRYQILTGAPVVIAATDTDFTVALPLISATDYNPKPNTHEGSHR